MNLINLNYHKLVVLFLLSIFAVLSFYTATYYSPTYDERAHYYAGLNYWQGQGPSNFEHPPLVKLYATFPAFILNLNFENGLLTSRALIIFLGVLLGGLIYAFSKELFGSNSAIISLTAFSFSPIFISLSSLLIMDVPMALFSLASVFFFIKAINGGEMKFFIISGLFLGLGIVSRFSSILILIGFFITIFLFKKNKIYENSKIILIVIGCAISVIISTYFFYDLNVFLPSLFKGLGTGLSHANVGQSTYFLGEFYNGLVPLYYFLGILIKTPISFLLLFIGSVFYLRENREKQLSAIMVTFFLVLSIFSTLQLGVRHIVFVYACACVLIGAVSRIKIPKKIIYLILAILAIESALFFPHYLAYTNQLTGSPKNAHNFVIGSNMEWGQYDYEIKKYLETHPDVKHVGGCDINSGKYLINANELHGMFIADYIDCEGAGWEYCGPVFSVEPNCFGNLENFEHLETVTPSWYVFEVK